MDADKKQTIIKEIERWRRSKLLPEHYCDFLLNLYLDEHTEKEKKVLGMSSTQIQSSSPKWWILFAVGIGILAYLILNFTLFPDYVQIGISAASVGILYIMGFRMRDTKPIGSLVLTASASVLILVIGMLLLYLHGLLGEASAVIAYLLFCSVVWVVSGIALRQGIFHLCGWIGCSFVYAWLLHHQIDAISWPIAQLCWLPLSFLFGWIAWLVHHRSKKNAVVLFITALLLWFMPEIYVMVLTQESASVMQLSLFGKIGAAGVLLFRFRKTWTEWVV
ncbi:hypothetical protein [Paenibacillus turpanensis]|uniref:hypothetical protein n=1 Tax=Paenibacillus turpanensis TaxID=2689078 RepID=UPI00140B69B2|nr:hypothetical protein [Paenibacillus turpanensis]